jgi:hypothetical protein
MLIVIRVPQHLPPIFGRVDVLRRQGDVNGGAH